MPLARKKLRCLHPSALNFALRSAKIMAASWLVAILTPAQVVFPAGVVPLTSGELVTKTVNPFTWTWFGLSLVVSESEDVTESYNALVQLDSLDTFPLGGQPTWASFDVMIVNETLPANAQTLEAGPVESGSPECWFNEACPGGYYARYKEAPRVTSAFGYNKTSRAGLVSAMRVIYVGVRETGMAPGTVTYSLRVDAVPRLIKDGMHFTSALPPCVISASGQKQGEDEIPFCRQYFMVHLADYDVLELTITRIGDNLTTLDAAGGVVSTGEGFAGSLLTGEPDHIDTPPPTIVAQTVAVSNTTTSAKIGYFCTMANQAGDYVVVVSPDGSDDFGFGSEDYLPRQGRGRFNVTVRHAAYKSGELHSPDVRGGCVHYGQIRNYTITSHNEQDGNFYANIEGGNVSFVRARCAGCEWVEARAPLSAVSASPCDLRNGTTWEMQIGLQDYSTATLAGLAPAEFTLSTTLQNASAYDGMRIRPASEGGDGYVCCGAVKSWILPDLPVKYAPAVQLNITSGHMRTVFIKVGYCPNPDTDVVGSVCTGNCELSWMTVYDAFYGTAEHTQNLGTLAAPFQLPWGTSKWAEDAASTERRAGDYYVSVHGLPGEAADFEMEILTLDPGPAPYQFACSRFDGFCPEDHYTVGFDGAAASAAGPRGGASRTTAAMAVAVPALLAVVRSTARRRWGF